MVYCYTGHTGQVATTALGLLGYDVGNMKYGMMGWTEDDEVLATARYNPETSPDYPVEGTAVEAPAAEETPRKKLPPKKLHPSPFLRPVALPSRSRVCCWALVR